jgi:SAM-dependent methyltransferase
MTLDDRSSPEPLAAASPRRAKQETSPDGLLIHYGAGWSCAEGWLNFDSSPSIWIERFPVIGRFVRVNRDRFPEQIMFGDIVRGLPVPDGSAAAAFASHVLEHLTYKDCLKALANTHRLLKPGGVFRLIVPDLASRARRYLERLDDNDAFAASKFLGECYLGRHDHAGGVLKRMRRALGNADHLSMWDELSMTAALQTAGFVDIRRCDLGDSAIEAFGELERHDRFVDPDDGYVEVAIESRKPAGPSC